MPDFITATLPIADWRAVTAATTQMAFNHASCGSYAEAATLHALAAKMYRAGGDMRDAYRNEIEARICRLCAEPSPFAT